MKTNINLLQADTYYHIFNRGNNSEILFKEERNYNYFLNKYALNIAPVADTYAYCLMNNHFHILIRVKTEEELSAFYSRKFPSRDPLNGAQIVST